MGNKVSFWCAGCLNKDGNRSKIQRTQIHPSSQPLEEDVKNNDHKRHQNNQTMILERARKTSDDFRRLQEMYQKLQTDYNDILRRYSEMVGARIAHNNPDIVNLGDPNRPTKIAEQYSELYDNEWTDAYDVLRKGMSEKKAIAKLLKVLLKMYDHCDKTAKGQLEWYDKFHGKSASSIPLLRNLKDARRKDVDLSLDCLYTDVPMILEEVLSPQYLQDQVILQYSQTCLRLCWLMAIQDTPVHMDTVKATKEKGKRKLLNKREYRAYMRDGDYVDFFVWPALFLYIGGPLLVKGTAQGTTKVKSKKKRNLINTLKRRNGETEMSHNVHENVQQGMPLESIVMDKGDGSLDEKQNGHPSVSHVIVVEEQSRQDVDSKGICEAEFGIDGNKDVIQNTNNDDKKNSVNDGEALTENTDPVKKSSTIPQNDIPERPYSAPNLSDIQRNKQTIRQNQISVGLDQPQTTTKPAWTETDTRLEGQ